MYRRTRHETTHDAHYYLTMSLVSGWQKMKWFGTGQAKTHPKNTGDPDADKRGTGPVKEKSKVEGEAREEATLESGKEDDDQTKQKIEKHKKKSQKGVVQAQKGSLPICRVCSVCTTVMYICKALLLETEKQAEEHYARCCTQLITSLCSAYVDWKLLSCAALGGSKEWPKGESTVESK